MARRAACAKRLLLLPVPISLIPLHEGGVPKKERFQLALESTQGNHEREAEVRGPWRIAAYADEAGLVCYQTYTALWPSGDWTATALAAVLNGPVANAFVASHEGNRDITVETVKAIPVPPLTNALKGGLTKLVAEYRTAAERMELEVRSGERSARDILREIDAAILRAYDLSPRLEHELLNYFSGYGTKRPVPFNFGDYYPADFSSHIPLWMFLSPEFQRGNPQDILSKAPKITDPALIDAFREVE